MGARTRFAPALRLAALALPVVLLLVTSCTTGNPYDTLTHRGEVSATLTDLYRLPFWIAVVVFFAVEGLLLFAVLRFRDRPGREREGLPVQTHGNTRLEIGWTIAPALVLAVIAVPTISTIVKLSREPANPLQVRVVGHQWWWEFVYTVNNQPVYVANEMHVPVGRRVLVSIESVDVIHSFWVPNLAGKMDAVPGHLNKMWFDAQAPGNYWGECAEFCGESHALMRFRVIAQPEADFNQWLANQARPAAPAAAAVQRGEQLFMGNACIGCHAIEGTRAQGRTAPNLTHFGSRERFGADRRDSTPENLTAWIKKPSSIKPGALMPAFGQQNGGALSDDDISAIVAYLQSLK
ncbi:MAG: cytochrome c oxidase subunit II [Dehalococcoidia bacterium]